MGNCCGHTYNDLELLEVFGGSGLTPLTFELGTPPTLILDASGVGDEALEIRPNCFFDYSATHYGLLYMAKANSANTSRTIKLATAPKAGFNHVWTKIGTVLTRTAAAWDDQLASATVVKDGSTWILMYEGFTTGQVGLATGTDLLSLTKHPSNPVLNNTAATTAFNRYLRHPTAVIKDDRLYCMYEGRNGSPFLIEGSKLGSAYCLLTDLTSWTINTTPLIEPTDIDYATGDLSNVANANIVEINGVYYWWHQAYSNEAQDELSYGGTSYSRSTDLENWTIVGTNNYHVYMGLFGYNLSSEYYETCQEVTPVWDGTTLSLYMWSATSSGIGKIDLDGGTFVNQFRGFTLADNFDDGSIDPTKWTTQNDTGITVSETGGHLQIVCDGTTNNSNFLTLVESNATMNNDDGAIVCVFDLQRSLPTTGDNYVVELSNAARTYAISFRRSTTTNMIRVVVIRNSVIIHDNDYAFDGDEVWKIFIHTRTVIEIWRGDSGGTYFDFVDRYSPTGMENITWSFKMLAQNSIGGGQTLSLGYFAFGEYDSGKISTFQT